MGIFDILKAVGKVAQNSPLSGIALLIGIVWLFFSFRQNAKIWEKIVSIIIIIISVYQIYLVVSVTP